MVIQETEYTADRQTNSQARGTGVVLHGIRQGDSADRFHLTFSTKLHAI